MIPNKTRHFTIRAEMIKIFAVSSPVKRKDLHFNISEYRLALLCGTYIITAIFGMKGVLVMKKTFVALVKRTEAWDHSREAHEQDGFADHAAYMGGLEAEGFIAMAGLLQETSDVLFIFLADSEDEVRARLAEDPWQKDGHARLVRLEEAHFRIGAPAGAAPG